jgi:chaperone BCS1
MFHDTSDDLGFANTKGRINLMALSPTVLEFVEECRRWYTSEKWFLERDIPWRLSVLLWSKPGLGKTTLLKAIAEMLDMPMYVFDLAMMSNVEFGEMWQRAASNAPCMIVFEDFDGVFKGRENVLGREGGGLTFDAVLNTLDGAGSVNGVLLGITTNHPESIDPAMGVASHDGMSSRPGRLDRIIEMPALDANGRLKIAKRILSDYPDMWDTTVAEGSKDSGAQFQDRCVRIAHTRFWSEKSDK